MDPLTRLYSRLCPQRPDAPGFHEPPCLEEWLRYWNEDDTDLGNLRNFEHWLRQARRHDQRLDSK